MTIITIINCDRSLERSIQHKNNDELLKYNIIILTNIPDLKQKNWKRILGKFKDKYTLTTRENSDLGNFVALIDKRIKAQRNWLDNSLIIDSDSHHNLIIQNFMSKTIKHELDTVVKRYQLNKSSGSIILGLANEIKHERLELRHIDTIINLNQWQTNEEMNRIKKGYMIVNTMEKLELINLLKTKDTNWEDTNQKFICFASRELENCQIKLTKYKLDIEVTRKSNNEPELKYEQITKVKLENIRGELFTDFAQITNNLCRDWSGRHAKFIHDRMNKLSNALYTKLIEIQDKITIKEGKRTTAKRYITENQSMTQLIKMIKETDQRIKKLESGQRDIENGTLIKAEQLKREDLAEKALDELNKQEFNRKFESDTKYEDNIWDRVHYADWILEGTEANVPILIESNEQLNLILENKFPFKLREMQKKIEKITGIIAYETTTPLTQTQKQKPNEDAINCLIYINEQEIERAFYELRNKTYSGIEGLKFKIFIEAYKYIKLVIHTICKMSFHIGLTPDNCRTTLGNLIAKKAANQFRIVHVSTPLASLLEQIALHRLEYRLEANNLYSPRQYGFTALKDRHDLILRLLSMIKEYEYKNKYGMTTLIGLDINGAFDNVDQDMIIKQLIRTMPQDNISIWLANFILYRYIRVRYNGMESNSKQIYMGVPQGSALGPILWNFTINTIDNGLRRENELEILAYADDIIMIHKSSIFDHDKTQRTLDNLVSKLETIRLDIRAEKCSTIFIKNSKATLEEQQTNEEYKRLPTNMKDMIEQAENTQMIFQIRGAPIDIADHINVLGVKITNKCKLKLNDSQSIEKITAATSRLKAYKDIGVMRGTPDWKILTDSYIKSRTLTNNFPILAIDYEACEETDKLMLNAYAHIFGWVNDERTSKTIKFITELYPTFEHTKQTILNRATKEHATETRQFIKAICNNVREHNLVTHCNEIDTRWNRTDMMNGITDNDSTTLTIQYEYTRRRYHDPSKPITVTMGQNLREILSRKVCWLIHSKKQGCTLTKYLNNRIRNELCITHSQYTIGYFNELAALWHLTSNTMQEADKNIIIGEKDALILALQNRQNHDWRIIELRERLSLQGWCLITLRDSGSLRSFIEESKKLIANHNIQIIKINLDQPNVQDYVDRYKSEQSKKVAMRKYMETICPSIITELDSIIPTDSWQKVDYTTYTTSDLLTLSGYIKIDQNSGWIDDRMARQKSIWQGCKCIRNGTVDANHTTLHRLMHCKYYNKLRIELKKQLDHEQELFVISKNAAQRKYRNDIDKIAKEVDKLDKTRITNRAIIYLKSMNECAGGRNAENKSANYNTLTGN